jgi:hypothetical protein
MTERELCELWNMVEQERKSLAEYAKVGRTYRTIALVALAFYLVVNGVTILVLMTTLGPENVAVATFSSACVLISMGIWIALCRGFYLYYV